MPNIPTEDRYNPAPIGSEFESHLFDDINIGEIFRLNANNNPDNQQYRKENETQAFLIVENNLYNMDRRQKVYVKI